MHAIQMLEEELIVEVVLFAEVAPRMGQDLYLLLIAHISEHNVVLQELYIVKLLLSDEDEPPLHTDLAECFLVVYF